MKNNEKNYTSILQWIVNENIVNEKGEALDFYDHAFLLDILTDWNKNLVVKACAQVGKSVSFTLKVLFAIKYLSFNVIYCVDTETELLAKNGWKKYNEVNEGDEILTLNPETGVSEYKPIKEVFIKKGVFDMIELKTSQFSALVTPNHRWLVNEKHSYGTDKNKYLFKETWQLPIGLDKLIPKSVTYSNKNKGNNLKYVELLSWIFTEGHYVKDSPKSTSIIITQSNTHNPHYVERIRLLIKDLGINCKEYGANRGCINFRISGDIPMEIKRMFPSKIPTHEYINGLSSEELEVFISVFLMGDGCKTKFGYGRLTQKDKNTCDVFCHALTLAGYSYSMKRHKMGWYTVSIMNNDRIWANNIKQKRVEYKGTIWCPRTDNGTFFARRNGTTYWTGNTFPSDDDVREFVASKVNKILQANRHEFEGMDTDSIERKEINDRFLFFKGTISKTAAISNTADLLVHDEASRSNQQALDTYKSRTKASDYKGRWLFSNPTTEKDILDQEWKKSNQKEWCITCPSCKVEHFMVWPDSIDLIKKCFKCRMCNEPISDDVRRGGRWVAQNPESEISGYHISHLIATKISAEEIIADSEGDQEYFHNFVLGEPYNPGDLSVSRSTITDIWTPKDLVTGNYFLGVDVGNIKHYVLGSEKGIIKVGRFSEWKDLDAMLAFYKPKMVIDAMPDNTMSKYYVDNYRGTLMSFFQENTANPQTLVWWGENDKRGIVYSHRDRIIDKMLSDKIEAKFLIGIPTNKELLEYVKHFETLRRVKVTNNKGVERYVWESTTGVDHYVLSTLYYYLAVMGGGSGVFYSDSIEEKKPSVINSDSVYDVSNMWSENNQ